MSIINLWEYADKIVKQVDRTYLAHDVPWFELHDTALAVIDSYRTFNNKLVGIELGVELVAKEFGLRIDCDQDG